MIPARPLRTVLQPTVSLMLVLATFQAGCSKSPPTSPLSDARVTLGGRNIASEAGSGFGSATFYPLVVGNFWTYEGGGAGSVLSGDGEPPWGDFHYAFTESHRLIGTTHHEGTAYVVEEQVRESVPEDGSGPGTTWLRSRQDASGLFGLDTVLVVPPPLDGRGSLATASPSRSEHTLRVDLAPWLAHGAQSASLERFADRIETLRQIVRGYANRRNEPNSPSGLEIQLLAYPLNPGRTWSNRPDFPWPSTVNRVETLETPAGRFTAYRIDIVPGGTPLAEGEWVRVWYSRAGYLGYSIRLVAQETDVNGEPTGNTYAFDDSMFVSSLQIAR